MRTFAATPPPPPAPPSARPETAAPAGRRRERGFALLLVLMMTSISIIVVSELAYQNSLELLSASNVSDQGLIEYAIDGQFELALAHLVYDKKQNDIDSEGDDWNATTIRERTDGDVALKQRIFDEGGKFNVMRLISGNEQQQARAKEVFIRLLDGFRKDVSAEKTKGGDLDVSDAEEITDRIIRHLKREGATGQVPKPKTNPANVPLLLDELLFCDSAKSTQIMDILLSDREVGEDKIAPGLWRYVTCYGSGKINVNTAPLAVLEALFSQSGDTSYAQGIIDRRRSAASDTAATGTGTSGMSGTSGTSGTSATSGTSGTSGSSEGSGNPFKDVGELTDGSVQGLTQDVLLRNGIDVASELDVKSDHFSIRIRGSTERTQRDELYVVERAKKTDGSYGFRFLLHQERSDALLDVKDDESSN